MLRAMMMVVPFSARPAVRDPRPKNAKPVKGGYYEVTIDPVRARYVRLVALSEVNGRGWASISELQVIDKDGGNLPRGGWSATASNSETKANYDTSPKCIIDGDPITCLQPFDQANPPGIVGALDHARGDEDGRRRAVTLQHGQGMGEVVAIAIVEGQGGETLGGRIVQPLEGGIRRDDADLTGAEMFE